MKPDGFQYCLTCNKAFRPSEPAHVQKNHNLEVVSEEDIKVSGEAGQEVEQIVVTQRCKRCGKMFGYNKTSAKYEEEDPSESKCDEEKPCEDAKSP